MHYSGLVMYVCLFSGPSLCFAQAITQPIKPADAMAQRVAACTACHGPEGRATSDGFFPRIAGKPAEYLYNQLINYKNGHRHIRFSFLVWSGCHEIT